MKDALWVEWTPSERSNCCFYLEDGILRMQPVSTKYRCSEERGDKSQLGVRFFNDDRYFNHVDPRSISAIFASCVGEPEAALKKQMDSFDERRREREEKKSADAAKWERLKDRFNGAVIGLDHEMDVYRTGFSVRVLLDTGMSFPQRRAFIKENKAELISWVMRELSENAGAAKRIGSLRFYRPSEITVLRAPEAEIKFEVKKILEEVV